MDKDVIRLVMELRADCYNKLAEVIKDKASSCDDKFKAKLNDLVDEALIEVCK